MHLPVFTALISVASAVLIQGPPGPYSVARKVQAFEDSARWDPLAPADKPEKRRVATSAFIPVKKGNCSDDVVPYMTPITAKAMAGFSASLGFALPDDFFDNLEMAFCKVGEACKSRRDASRNKYPVVLFSPGLGGSRHMYGVLARSLASYGYVVLTLDHTYETGVVEFPDGSVVYGVVNATGGLAPAYLESLVETRRADFSFVIDQLQTPDVAAQLVAGMGASIDSDKVFVYGHSLGGATSAATILTDDRVLGGLNFDGAMYGPVPIEGSDKLLVLAGQPVLPQTVFPGVPSWNETYDKHQGPALIVTINGTMHPTFLDAPQLPPIKELLKNPDYTAALQGFLGTIDGDRAGQLTIDIVRTALHSVFDGKKDELCNIEKLGPELDLLKIKGLGCPQE
ncbi:hypothetical protein CGMCC3_g5839 [Colletotrichum fructicola]|uniref:1-alkyl-2-acetylglycerophosphocholine esterase n=1 Tax=Colletotrichum fructicola (strain Nara gc5) TaxID=1213859 RepID=L2GEQ0_COLFN|nr:uncharacterized protein CGMCC3_g5839 [Colletotrichum fructicola]KAF4489632.1 putative 1-alkyl-2-acetylglycerophosphocholine esterase [Colletotrichum fructicola Nara gc5]KAI8289730.1 hypothetical protein K4K60_007976 [Colletotrichum sp. SAR11_57]KAE9578059.1 hypothetical protein CGMCC3_g5839 [Colletotrichum fructicola]KAF4425628.1 putative 1-alkyl-2-acetylglycerophosphocholine esterase [Colletotrichum fructicola]KAF4896340.1 putative 1-alkyl-2-acetylglycerophosphocholine esterase [Colletotri